MIVVIGELGARGERGATAQAVAVRAAAVGSRVEIVGLVPDDAEGDRRILAFAAADVGHAAVLRGVTRALEAEDVDLALRYLPDIRVIVGVGLSEAIVAVVSEQAAWSGAALIVVRTGKDQAGADADAGAATLPEGAVVLEAPPSDPDGTFAGFVGSFAARLDGGATAADAWAATTRELAVDPA